MSDSLLSTPPTLPAGSHGGPAVPLASRADGPLRGEARLPGDKSMSHRALILGLLAVGETRVTGLLEGDDVLRTADACRALGADVVREGEGAWRVHGRGVGGLSAPRAPLDFGNAGTGSRLMMGVVGSHPITAVFDGDASLRRRPMRRILDPLVRMGAEVLAEGNGPGLMPLTIRGADPCLPVVYESPVASAQVKSAVLLAGLNAAGQTSVIEREATRDHTERMLRAFGAEVAVETLERGATRVTVTGDAELRPASVAVPADPSSAAFPLAAALLCPGSDVTLAGVMTNPTRTGLLQTLREMGADVTQLGEREAGGESVADLRVRAPAEGGAALRGADVPAARAPSMIDEYPILAVIAAFARGTTRMRGLGELRVKESDRLAAVLAGLRANGVEAAIEGDDLLVEGAGGVEGGGLVATHLDHRIAMSFLVMGLASRRPVTVDDGAMIATSFPDFVPLMRRLGATVGPAGAGGAA